MNKLNLISQVIANDIYPTLDSEHDISEEELLQKFLSQILSMQKRLSGSLIYDLLSNSNKELNLDSIADLVFADETRDYMKRKDRYLCYRFLYHGDPKDTKKDWRGFISVGEFQVDKMVEDKVIGLNAKGKPILTEIQITNRKYLKYLRPVISPTLSTIMREKIEQGKDDFCQADTLAHFKTVNNYDMRLRAPADVRANEKVAQVLTELYRTIISKITKLAKESITKAYSLSNLDFNGGKSVFNGLVYYILESMGIITDLDRFLTPKTVFLLVDLVALLLYKDELIIREKDDMFSHIRTLTPTINSSSVSILTKQLKRELSIGYENNLQLITNFFDKAIAKKEYYKDEEIVIDSSAIKTTSDAIDEKEVGIDSSTKQSREVFKYTMAYSLNTGQIIQAFVKRGNYLDVNLGTSFFTLLKDLGYKNLKLVLDRGFYSKDQLSSLMMQGYKVNIMAKKNKALNQVILDNYEYLTDLKHKHVINNSYSDKPLYAKTIELDSKELTNAQYQEFLKEYSIDKNLDTKLYAVIFKEVNANVANKKLELDIIIDALNSGQAELVISYLTEEEVETNVEVQNRKIIKQLDDKDGKKSKRKASKPKSKRVEKVKLTNKLKGLIKYGEGKYYLDIEKANTAFFLESVHVIVTNYKPESEKEIIDLYHKRNDIEIQFKSIKSGSNQSSSRSHSSDTAQTRLILTTLAQMVRNYLNNSITSSDINSRLKFKYIKTFLQKASKMTIELKEGLATKEGIEYFMDLPNAHDKRVSSILGCKDASDLQNRLINIYTLAAKYGTQNYVYHANHVR